MIRPQINQLPGTADLIAAQTKVAGDPAVMRQIASTWRATSHRAADVSSSMVNFINDVDLKWEGDSADAFDTYMRRFPKAGEGLNTAVEACAGSLDSTAKAFEDAKTGIAGLINEVIDGAVTQMTDYMNNHGGENGENYSKAMTSLSSSPTFTGLVSTKTTAAKGHVTKVEESVAATQKTMNAQLPANVQDSGMGFFSAIPDPGGPDFDPGNKPIVWDITPYKDRTQLSGGNGGGGGGGGGVSSGGTAPAPKAEVVEWIKQALTIIKSPEMADVMRERGLDVSDLDPNDPKDIQRIWTIIYNESGGNPSAINNWDINAKNGIPSQGLMQTIPPTFNAHALPGHKKILEPVDNIIAGVLYTYSRYGNLANHPGIASLEGGGGYKPY